MDSAIAPKSAKELRRWLDKHVETTVYPLWVMIYKKTSGKQGLTYDEVLEEAICFGLIDTQTKTIDEERYGICLRHRKPDSNWTKTNKKIAHNMIKTGRMTKQGLTAFKA